MLRSLQLATLCRLLGWILFAACLAFIGWGPYVILPVKPRWVVPDLTHDPSCDDIPIYIFEDGSGTVCSGSRLFLAGFSSRNVRYRARNLSDGSERAEISDGQAIFVDDTEFSLFPRRV